MIPHPHKAEHLFSTRQIRPTRPNQWLWHPEEYYEEMLLTAVEEFVERHTNALQGGECPLSALREAIAVPPPLRRWVCPGGSTQPVMTVCQHASDSLPPSPCTLSNQRRAKCRAATSQQWQVAMKVLISFAGPLVAVCQVYSLPAILSRCQD